MLSLSDRKEGHEPYEMSHKINLVFLFKFSPYVHVDKVQDCFDLEFYIQYHCHTLSLIFFLLNSKSPINRFTCILSHTLLVSCFQEAVDSV